MSENLYRKDAVDNLISVEELDRAPRVIELRAWTLLNLFALAVIGCAVFSYFVEVPVSVSAEGIVWTPEGIRNLAAESHGVAEEILVAPAQEVKKGDVIAVIDQSELRAQLSELEADLEETNFYIKQLQSLDSEEKKGRKEYDDAIDKILAASTKRYHEKEGRVIKREKELEKLLKRGAIRREDVDRMVDELADTREHLSSIVQERATQTKTDLKSDIQVRRELLTQRHQASETADKIAGIRKQLLEDGEIVSPFDGRVSQVEVDPGDFVSPGTTIATVAPYVTERELLAIVYPAYEDGAKLRSGMAVELEISAYPKQKFGLLSGTVVDVSHLPVSSESMMRTLKNDLLVRKLTGKESPFEVSIRLDKDSADPSGYQWSARADDTRNVRDGMRCVAKVIVRTKKLYELLSPEPF